MKKKKTAKSIRNLPAKTVNAKAAKKVRGGITVKKVTDSSSPLFFRN